MKVIICDVGDAACAFVTSTNGHTMMIDCGSNEHKENPVTVFNRYKRWLGTKEYCTQNGEMQVRITINTTNRYGCNQSDFRKNFPAITS